MTANPLRSETLARDLLKSFFQVDVPAPPMLSRQEADMLLPLVPALVDGQPMLKATLPPWRRSDPDVPQVRTAAIAAKLVKERPRRTRVIWLRKSGPSDWRRDLLRLVDAYETGRLRIFANGIACHRDGWCSFPSARVGTGY